LTLVQLDAWAASALTLPVAAAVTVPGLLSAPPPQAAMNAAVPTASKAILLLNALILVASRKKRRIISITVTIRFAVVVGGIL
jgi:hypothetical protein